MRTKLTTRKAATKSHNAENSFEFNTHLDRKINANDWGYNESSGRCSYSNYENHINDHYKSIGSQFKWPKQTHHYHLSNRWVLYTDYFHFNLYIWTTAAHVKNPILMSTINSIRSVAITGMSLLTDIISKLEQESDYSHLFHTNWSIIFPTKFLYTKNANKIKKSNEQTTWEKKHKTHFPKQILLLSFLYLYCKHCARSKTTNDCFQKKRKKKTHMKSWIDSISRHIRHMVTMLQWKLL